jgi:hypothetical protein
MNQVQELIDEHMNELPVSLAKKTLEACKEEADAKPKLYYLKMIKVQAITYMREIEGCEPFPAVQLINTKQGLIVELVERSVGDDHCVNLFEKGIINSSWLRFSFPHAIDFMPDGDGPEHACTIVIHSIKPFDGLKKRCRRE